VWSDILGGEGLESRWVLRLGVVLIECF